MRKKWIVICAATMLAISMTGCGGNASSGESKASKTDSKTQTETKQDEKTKGGESYKFEQVVYDQENVKITAAGYEIDRKGTHALIMKVQNDTDSTVGLMTNGLYINGMVMESNSRITSAASDAAMLLAMADATGEDVDDYIERKFHPVAAGETKEITIDCYVNDAKEECLGTIQQIDVAVAVAKFTDMENKETLGAEDLPAGEMISIHTDKFEGELKLPEVEGTEVYNKGGIRLVIMSMEYDEDYNDFTANIYAENHSDKVISISSDSVSINDFVVDMHFYMYDLAGGQMSVESMDSYDLDEIEKLDDIENMEINFTIEDENTFEIIDTAVYTYAR